MLSNTESKSKLLSAFKSILKEESFGSQVALATAMSTRGFGNISQTKISRLLLKLGAIKVRNASDDAVYRLPSSCLIPNKKQTINSVVLDIQHNRIQIVVKTIAGGGRIISKIIESMPSTTGILGCIASNDTVLVIPCDINKIDDTIKKIIDYLKVSVVLPTKLQKTPK